MPIGKAKIKKIAMVRSEPVKLAAMPAASGSRESALFKNCQLKMVFISPVFCKLFNKEISKINDPKIVYFLCWMI